MAREVSRDEPASQAFSLEALREIPDPAARVAARPAPSAPSAPSIPSPTRAERQTRIRFAIVVAAAWVTALVVRFGVRPNLGAPLVIAMLALWAALAGSSLALVLMPRDRGLPSGVRALSIALGSIPAVYLVSVMIGAASAPDVPITWASTAGCLGLANVVALGPIFLAALLLRRTFLTAPALRGAAVGAACGLFGAIGAHAHCPVEAASHVLLAHGAPIAFGAIVGALLGAMKGRA